MRYLRLILVLALLSSWAPAALCQKIDPDAFRNGPKILATFRPVVAKPSEATVRVLVDGKEVAFGTIVDSAGWIITKWSEIERQNRFKGVSIKLKDGKVLKAEIKGYTEYEKTDRSYDLAMLKVDAKGLPAVQWRSSKEATVGKWVASPGLGADPVAVGVVSVATRAYKANDQPPKSSNINAGFLGVAGLQDAEEGAKIGGVAKGGPAEKAGLKANDIIYEAAGRRIINAEALIDTIGRLKPGDKVLLKIKRGAEEREIEAILGKRNPKDFLNPQEVMGTRLSSRRGGFPTILQHDSGIRPEDCGGPLVDLDGKTIGINIARAGRTETYAIPAEDIQSLIPDLKSGKFAPPRDESPVARVRTPDFVVRASLSATDKVTTLAPADKNAKHFMRAEEVKLSAGVTYVIQMTTEEKKMDPFLMIEDAKGKKLADDDDSGGYPNAKIVFRAPADGVYRIICTTFNPNETGSYTLSVRKQTDAEKENPKK